MLTKVAFGLAIVLATVSGSLGQGVPSPRAEDYPEFAYPARAVGHAQKVYSKAGTDADQGVRFELNRGAGRAHAN